MTLLYIFGVIGITSISAAIIYYGCKAIDAYDEWKESRK